MKKAVCKFGKVFAIVFAALMVLSLASCSGLIQKTGSVSFVVDQELLNAARAPFGGGNDNAFRLEIVLEGKGSYKLKQTLYVTEEKFEQFSKHGSLEASFDSVPAGKSLSALVKVFHEEPNSTGGVSKPMLIGRSDTFRVKPGNNKVSVPMCSYDSEFRFEIHLDASELSTDLNVTDGNTHAYVILADSKTGRKILSAGTKKRKVINAIDSIDFENDVIATTRVLNFTGYLNVLQDTFDKFTFHDEFVIPVDEKSPLLKGQKVLFLFANANPDTPEIINHEIFAATKAITPIKGKYSNSSCSFMDIPLAVPKYVTMYKNTSNSYDYSYYLVDSVDAELVGDGNYTDCGSYTGFDKAGEFYTISYYQYSNKSLKLYSTNTNITDQKILEDDLISYEINSYYKDWDIEYIGFAIDTESDTFYAFANQKQETHQYNGSPHYNVSSVFHILKYPSLISSGTIDDKETYTKDFPDYLPVRMVVNNGICYCLAKSATDNSYTLFTFAFGDEDPTKTKVKIITNLSSLARCTDMVYLNDYVYILFNDNNDSRYDGYIPASYSGYDYNSSGVLVQYDSYTRSAVELGNSKKISFSKMYVGEEDNAPGEELFVENGSLATLSGSTVLTNNEKLSKYFPSVRSPKESKLSTSFIGSDKFLAIMPKKLVVSDYGRFYYADVNDALAFNTKNRTVDIDLEGFFIAAVTDSTNYFDEDNENHSQATSIEAMTFDYADLQNLIPNGLAPEDIWGYQSWSSSDFLAIKSENYPEP